MIKRYVFVLHFLFLTHFLLAETGVIGAATKDP